MKNDSMLKEYKRMLDDHERMLREYERLLDESEMQETPEPDTKYPASVQKSLSRYDVLQYGLFGPEIGDG